MGGIGGRLSMLMREIVRFRGIESGGDEVGKGFEGGGGESPVGSDEGQKEGEIIYVWPAKVQEKREGK